MFDDARGSDALSLGGPPRGALLVVFANIFITEITLQILCPIVFKLFLKKWKRFPKELDIVSKRWKHLETFHEKEGLSKMEF